MSGARGAEFGEIAPVNSIGHIRVANTVVSPTDTFGLAGLNTLENGPIQIVSPYGSYRLGQQIIFWLGIFNPANPGDGNFASRVQLKPWWARPNLEKRQPGQAKIDVRTGQPVGPGWLGIDGQTFLGTTEVNNRYVWIPSPKRLDLTPFLPGPTPPPSPPRHSDSLFLDDIWDFELQSPADPAYAAAFPAPQIPSRWAVFMYPAMGYALGFTHIVTPNNAMLGAPSVSFTISWAVGTLGGSNYQESIG